MQYIQIVNQVVNLIGDEEVGLPLPEAFLKENPHVLNIKAAGHEDVTVGDYYDPDTKQFSKLHPQPMQEEA